MRVKSKLEVVCETLKTRVKLNLNFTRPHAITYTNCTVFSQSASSNFVMLISNVYKMNGRSVSVYTDRAVTKALIEGWIFIYSCSARRISFEISCHYS